MHFHYFLDNDTMYKLKLSQVGCLMYIILIQRKYGYIWKQFCHHYQLCLIVLSQSISVFLCKCYWQFLLWNIFYVSLWLSGHHQNVLPTYQQDSPIWNSLRLPSTRVWYLHTSNTLYSVCDTKCGIRTYLIEDILFMNKCFTVDIWPISSYHFLISSKLVTLRIRKCPHVQTLLIGENNYTIVSELQ